MNRDYTVPQASTTFASGVGCGHRVRRGVRDRHRAPLIYARADLTLSHYDARAHLVVARRVVDSLTPGWRQLGGVWLPLPHLINLIPVQWDSSYRTGRRGGRFVLGGVWPRWPA